MTAWLRRRPRPTFRVVVDVYVPDLTHHEKAALSAAVFRAWRDWYAKHADDTRFARINTKAAIYDEDVR